VKTWLVLLSGLVLWEGEHHSATLRFVIPATRSFAQQRGEPKIQFEPSIIGVNLFAVKYIGAVDYGSVQYLFYGLMELGM